MDNKFFIETDLEEGIIFFLIDVLNNGNIPEMYAHIFYKIIYKFYTIRRNNVYAKLNVY